MKLGVAMFATDEGIRPGELARLAEERGFESLFFPDHTHIPVSRESPAPRGGELPREYSRTLDLFVALTDAAMATDRIRIGSGLCLVCEHEPIATAKAVATLDYLSGGRFLFGVGAGWNVEEMRTHGIDPERRFGAMKHRVLAMKRIWTEDVASYESPHVSFGPLWSWPKPVQVPHPPVLIGGNGPGSIDRVLAYGDGWLPEPEPGLTDRIAELVRRAKASGRDVGVTVYGIAPEDLEAYDDAGAHRCVFWLPPREPADTVRRLDELATLIR
jgi:probable F420-dependent oxidoreductase